MKNPASYIPNKMIVREIKGLSPDTKSLVLEFVDKEEARGFSFKSGQFVIVSVLGFGESVFAITTTEDDLPKIEIAVRSVGNTTRAIHRLNVGDEVGLRGPYGKGYPFDKFAGKEVIVVAGGLGLAPLRSLINTVGNDPKSVGKLKIFAGAKTPEDFIYKYDFKKWEKFSELELIVNTCDSDWKGHVGLVTDPIKKSNFDKDSVAIICGPPIMFAPVIEILTQKGLVEKNIYVMLERRMKCGIGKCQHCTCGEKYVCLDGPIFSWDEVKSNWEALV